MFFIKSDVEFKSNTIPYYPPPPQKKRRYTNDSFMYRLYYTLDSNKNRRKNVLVDIFSESFNVVSFDNVQILVHLDLLFVYLVL